MSRDVDFHHVAPRHEAVHARLENWARWCRGGSRQSVSPMFRQVQADHTWTPPEPRADVDQVDALAMNRAVVALPEELRHATQWAYIIKGSPAKACRQMGCNPPGLAALVTQARDRLSKDLHTSPFL